MTLFKVINRVSRKEQIFNSDELQTFFRYNHDIDYLKEGKRKNEWKDYAVSAVEPKEDVLEPFIIAGISVVFVICVTKIIMQWI
tara:strand:- start:339 stop:590 length:252 start_codon:yes stop_codon:yes gene_type:complete